MLKFNTRFSPPKVPGITAKGGLSDQHFKEECDLNFILKRFRATGIPAPAAAGVYADLTAIPTSIDEAFDSVQNAVEWFDTLPSDVRKAFGNDPRNALRLVHSDPKAAIAAGLLPASVSSEAKPIVAKAAEAADPEPPKAAKGAAAPVATQSED